MGKIRTSAKFYRRGVSNENRDFGFAMQSNNSIIKPVSLYIASQNRNNSPRKPSPPINLQFLKDPDGLYLTWTEPVSNGGYPITSYTATSNPVGFNASSTTTNIEITGLTAGIEYTLTVFATNIVGNSAPSSPLTIKISEPKPPTEEEIEGN